MSMHTIYVLMKDGEVVNIAPYTAADQALEYFKQDMYYTGAKGQVYACHMSETAAKDVRDAFTDPSKFKKTPASVLVKRYSSYMNHCADVT